MHNCDDITKEMERLFEENMRVLDFNYNSEEEYKKLEKEFNQKTSILNKKDQAFLWICIALQLVRQVV